MRISKIFPTPLFSLVFLLAFVAFLVAGQGVIENVDMPWHLATGELIWQTGQVAPADPWSYVSVEWYNISWLWDALIAAIVHVAGLKGLYVFNAALAAATLGYLACALKARGVVSELYILLAMLLVWYVMLTYLAPLPWMATFFLTVLFHNLMHRSRKNPRVLYWLPPLMLLWVNMHGGFIAGFSVIVFAMIEAQQTSQRIWFRQLAICLVACTAACLVNPWGIGIITAVMRTMDSIIQPYIAYWRALTFGDDTSLTLFLLLFVIVTNLREPRIPPADKMLAISWMIYGLLTRRNFIIFALVAAPYFACCLQEFARYAQAAKFKAVETFIPDSPANRKKFSALAMMAILAAFVPPTSSLFVTSEKLHDDPYQLREAVHELLPLAQKTHFLNDYNLGGFLILESGGKWPVFADPRGGTAYSEEVLKDMIAFQSMLPGYEELFDKYQAGGVILSKHLPFVRAYSRHDWKLVYENDAVAAFVRR